MNKNGLAAAVASKTGLTKKQVAEITDALLQQIAQTMATGEKVQLAGFGTFETRDRRARMGKNPQTGKFMQVEAGKVPKFRPGKQLKEAVNR